MIKKTKKLAVVKKGQIYMSRDPRENGRQVRVEKVNLAMGEVLLATLGLQRKPRWSQLHTLLTRWKLVH
ncbi:MAG: hypothetical protein WC789_14285 [Lentisphaeria bacterium]